MRAEANELRRTNDSLAAQAASARADAGTLDARLAATHARLARLREQAEVLAEKHVEARLSLRIARDALRISQRRLAERVRALYERGQPEPLAVILGADSLDDAVDGVEQLTRLAQEDRRYVERAVSARKELAAATAALARRQAENARLRTAAAEAAAFLIRARAERLARIATLAAQRNANGVRISTLEASARSLAIAASSAPMSGPTVLQGAPTGTGARLLTVVATGYSLEGQTASGIPVGPGVVAVDPAVIPLGARLAIPGYGEGVAADTGGAIQGARIDLWFSSVAEARAWGRRTVTVAVHG
jgi:3D (Asp-Asp-Asp) domain-containing protein